MQLKIRNWDKWQSYRSDRGQPPWIKLHRILLRNAEWVALNDQQRGQLVAMWLLAADQDGVIPASPRLIAKLCYMDDEPDIELFMDHGFIERDVNVASPRRQDDRPEKSRGDKSREEESRGAKTAARFRPPSQQEVIEYCQQRGNGVDAGAFIAYYESNGWKVGRNKMRDWQAAVRTWEKRNENGSRTGNRSNGIAKLQRIAAEDDPEKLGGAAVPEDEPGVRATLDGTYRRH